MKITVVNQTESSITFYVEREKGVHNHVDELIADFTAAEIEGLNADEIKTYAWHKVKPIAVRVFEQIEPLDENDNPIDFTLVLSRPVRLEIIGNPTLMIGDTAEYHVIVYDQYEQVMYDASPTISNSTITATEVGEVTVTATLGDLSTSMTVGIIERPKTKEEQLQELIDQLILDNLNMQIQIDTLIMSSLEV